MCSKLTPRAPIPDSRIAQFMQPCAQIDRALFRFFLSSQGTSLPFQKLIVSVMNWMWQYKPGYWEIKGLFLLLIYLEHLLLKCSAPPPPSLFFQEREWETCIKRGIKDPTRQFRGQKIPPHSFLFNPFSSYRCSPVLIQKTVIVLLGSHSIVSTLHTTRSRASGE